MAKQKRMSKGKKKWIYFACVFFFLLNMRCIVVSLTWFQFAPFFQIGNQQWKRQKKNKQPRTTIIICSIVYAFFASFRFVFLMNFLLLFLFCCVCLIQVYEAHRYSSRTLAGTAFAVELAFCIVMIIEFISKTISCGWKSYFKNIWCLIDLFNTIVSILFDSARISFSCLFLCVRERARLCGFLFACQSVCVVQFSFI